MRIGPTPTAAFTVPFTEVPVSVHVAPDGTRRLSTVSAPMVPRHVRSSAAATAGNAGAAALAAPAASSRLLPWSSGFPHSLAASGKTVPVLHERTVSRS
jgi:hypothetical protein